MNIGSTTVPSIMSVDDAAATIFNFTIDEQAYKETSSCVRLTREVDFTTVHSELILMTVIVVDFLLRSDRIHQIHGQKTDEIFQAYLDCFKEQTTVAGADRAFIALLNDRGNVYNEILGDGNLSSELSLVDLTFKIANYCGGSSGEFHLAVLRDFGSVMDKVAKFLETVHLK